MPFLDDHATSDLRILASALRTAPGTPEYGEAFALIESWADGDLRETDDAGTPWIQSPSRGLHARLNGGTLSSVSFELAANSNFEPFTDPTRLLVQLDPSMTASELRAVFGDRIESAYGNDWYLLDALDAAVILTWRPNGSLQRLMLLAADAADLARLRRKAAKISARTSSPVEERTTVVEVPEEDGILGIVDPDRYRPSRPRWDFASLSRHLETESVAGRGAFWRAGPPEFARYVVEVRATASDRVGERESEHVVRASEGRLRLVGYGTLTMAADSAAKRLDEDPDADIAVSTGRLLLRIRQFSAPDDAHDDEEIPIEVVVQPLGRRRAEASAQLAWWPEI